ncbi:hypothetical protein ACFQGT_17745 [Natrialbaceae archaeon GCM10025810]|uniref:hypothetical protein n=1 Tax=Halovalidus salilacus TaxID=3075124 RepID=UPI00361A5724
MSSNTVDRDEPAPDRDAAAQRTARAVDGTDTTETDETTDRLELAAQVELLEEENRRLRDEYARAQRSQYRRTATGLALVGAVAALGGAVFPTGREVLFVLAAIGLFGAVLTYYLTPGAFVAASVGERIYAALARNEAAIADELGLCDERHYLPDRESDVGPDGAGSTATLYVPQDPLADAAERSVLAARATSGPFLTDPDRRGLLLEPTGASLFDEFARALTADLAPAAAPGALATQLADGLVEQLELARSATPDVDADAGRATIAIDDSAVGDVDRFDHPIASFLAVGFANGLERPVRLEVARGDERADWLVTCRWDEADAASSETDADRSDAPDGADASAAIGAGESDDGGDGERKGSNDVDGDEPSNTDDGSS